MKDIDVIIIGAGIVGSATALRLLEEGLRVVCIAPLETLGSATPAAGAMIDAFGECELADTETEQNLLALRLKGLNAYPNWLEFLSSRGADPVVQHPGIYLIGNAGGDHDIARLALIRNLMRKHNEPFADHDPSQVPGLQPHVSMRAHSALFLERAFSVDVTSLSAAVDTALNSYANYQRMPVKALRVESADSGWQALCENDQQVAAPHLVIAAGAHSSQLLSEPLKQEFSLPEIYYGRGVSLLVDGAPSLPHTLRTTNRALACGIHLVPRQNGQLYLGASNLFGMDPNLPAGPTVGELHALLGTLCEQLNTGLRNVTVKQVQWGLRPVTANGLPHIGPSLAPGLHFATGTHRCGITMAPFIGDEVLAGITGKSTASLATTLATPTPHTKDVALGIRSLLAASLYPDGKLPYNRGEELEVFMTELFRMAFDHNSDEPLKHTLQALYNNIELDEQSMMRVFQEILRAKLPERGPHIA